MRNISDTVFKHIVLANALVSQAVSADAGLSTELASVKNISTTAQIEAEEAHAQLLLLQKKREIVVVELQKEDDIVMGQRQAKMDTWDDQVVTAKLSVAEVRLTAEE